MKNLNLGYIDLYLIHFPIGYESSKNFFSKDNFGKPLHSHFDLLDTWRAMESLVDEGLVKSIGISNFNIKQVDYIFDNARIKPVTNQIECHPYLINSKLREHCKSKNIAITAYSPLGNPGIVDMDKSVAKSLFKGENFLFEMIFFKIFHF